MSINNSIKQNRFLRGVHVLYCTYFGNCKRSKFGYIADSAKLMNGISNGSFYTIPVDPNYFSRYFPKEWFSLLTKYRFEDHEFIGVADYENYLTSIYHDYLQLPPEEKRRVHCDNVFSRADIIKK